MKILFIGNVMIGRLVNCILERTPPAYLWGDTLPIFQRADVRICNLECVISDRGTPWSHSPKVFHFRTDAKNISALQAAGINVVSLANNHTLDYEFEAMFEMLQILDGAGIHHAGAGANIDDASRPALFEIQGSKIGFISFTDNEPDWAATAERPGVFHVPVNLEDERARRLLELIQQTKKEVHWMIVSAHWGPNWGYRPRPSHIPFAKALIDHGADVVFGHSGHVFQGIQIYKGRPILYSTGDFIDDYAVDEIERNDQSFIFFAEISRDKILRLWLRPTVIKKYRARLAKESAAGGIAKKMQNLCAEFNTATEWNEKEQCIEVKL